MAAVEDMPPDEGADGTSRHAETRGFGMLIKFTVRNFRSIHGEQSFTFCTSSDPMHAATHCIRTGLKSVPRVSKSAVIFGPNGSGKTNLINAIAVMRDLVLRSTTFSPGEFSARHTPFALEQCGGNGGKATEFEVDVLLGKVRYQYAFAHDKHRICFERLLVYQTGKSQRWFERSSNDSSHVERWAPFSNNFAGPRVIWKDATRSQALYLTTAAQLNARDLKPLFDWFEHGVALVFASDRIDQSRLAACIQDEKRKHSMLEFLRSAGIRVHDIRIAEPPAIRNDFSDRKGRARVHEQKTIEFCHLREDGKPVWMPLSGEATGVQRMVSLFGPLLTAIKGGRLLLIDEFDLSLHPLVARYLIQLVNNPEISKDGAQLLLTSHNSTLMDMDILRRDEIWLMELNDGAASTLLRMWNSASPPRKNELIGKRYLYGHYGAVPAIKLPEIIFNSETMERNSSGNLRAAAF